MSPIDPVEAAAKAIFEHWLFQYATRLAPVAWVPGGNSLKQDEARAYARAALTALRDNGVTEGMVEAWVIVPPTPDCDPAENCAAEFRAMLDAALEGN